MVVRVFGTHRLAPERKRPPTHGQKLAEGDPVKFVMETTLEDGEE
jgi:hypothetical protein